MPTGYTAGIIDGEITTFEQFAKRCMRAFGATMHMRDEAMDSGYKPQEPSDYHRNKISDVEKKIEEIKQISAKKVGKRKKQELQQEIKRCNNQIKESKKIHKRLSRMLEDVKDWDPPTENHNKFKEFMIEQIEKTIDFDVMTDFYEKEVAKCENQITNVIGDFYKKQWLEDLNSDLEYHKKEHKKAVDRCKDSNEWVSELMKAL